MILLDMVGFEALLQSVKELQQDWGISLSDLLKDFLAKKLEIENEASNHCNFSECALIVQNAKTVYCKRVDVVHEIFRNFCVYLENHHHAGNDEGGESEGRPKRAKRTKVMVDDEFKVIGVATAKNLAWIDLNKLSKANLPKLQVNTHMRVQTKSYIHIPVLPKGDPQKRFKHEFRMNWRVAPHGQLEENLNSNLYRNDTDLDFPDVIEESDAEGAHRDLGMDLDESFGHDSSGLPEKSEVTNLPAPDPMNMTVIQEEAEIVPPPVALPSPPPPPPPKKPAPQPKSRVRAQLWTAIDACSNKKGLIRKLKVKNRVSEPKNIKNPLDTHLFILLHRPLSTVPLEEFQQRLFKAEKERAIVVKSRDAAKQAALVAEEEHDDDDDCGRDQGFGDLLDDDEELPPPAATGLDLTGLNIGLDIPPVADAALADIDAPPEFVVEAHPLLSAAAREQQMSDIAARVKEWHDDLAPKLELAESKATFDVQETGTIIINTFPRESRLGEAKLTFDKFLVGVDNVAEVGRRFLASLMMANTGNVDLNRISDTPLAVNDFEVILLSRERHHDEMHENLRATTSSDPH